MRLRWWLPALLCLGVAQRAEAHDPPVVTGLAEGPDGSLVLRTTRGLVVGASGGGKFALQCLDYSQLLPAETPSVAFRDATLFVAGVEGLATMRADGCGVVRPEQFAGVPMTDVHRRTDRSLTLLTTGAGMVNDAWSSSDGALWTPRGFALVQTLYSALRPFGARELATGVRVDAALGRPVHFVREIAGSQVISELEVDVGQDGYRVHLLDVRDGERPEALVLVDRYRESVSPDLLLRYREGVTAELLAASEVVDAKYAPDGSVYAASATGLIRIAEDGSTSVVGDGRRATMVGVAGGRVFTATEYYVDGCALCRVTGDTLEPLLRFGEIAGPTVCGDAPGICDTDWADWRREIAPTDAADATTPSGSGSGDPEVVSTMPGYGCSASGAGAAALLPALSVMLVARKRRSRRWLAFAGRRDD